jgi:hypothetical protein
MKSLTGITRKLCTTSDASTKEKVDKSRLPLLDKEGKKGRSLTRPPAVVGMTIPRLYYKNAALCSMNYEASIFYSRGINYDHRLSKNGRLFNRLFSLLFSLPRQRHPAGSNRQRK